MISLELFKKIVTDILEQEKNDEILTNILVCKECNGWINSAENITNDLVQLLQYILKDKYEYLTWWLYDCGLESNHKFIYEDLKNGEEIEYNLNNLEDLYYYILEDYSKVKQRIKIKEEKLKYTHCNQSMDDILNNIKNSLGLE